MRRALVPALVVALSAACGTAGPAPIALPDIQNMQCPAATTHLPASNSTVGALRHVAAVETRPLKGRAVLGGHGPTGPEAPIAARGAERAELATELAAAAEVACSLRTPADAQRAGYVLSSAFQQGVGAHWTNWALIDKPFDAMRPSMLLYASRLGRNQLVGFSYWIRVRSSGRPPDGFAGPDDRWHQHFGLCFTAAGMLAHEGVANPNFCDGSWLNGTDLWMLHAWIVPGDENPWGVFAPLNPTLCSRTVADIERCPGFD